ncbi:MAG: hypothetical protein JXQ73_03450 [Phycisphaerae bacterium]|nr:hypothetical protein [Phycisphaerae bacterium]
MTRPGYGVVVACSLLIVGLMPGVCRAGKEVKEVTFSYIARPSMSLPRGIKTVAVLDAETSEDAEKKWSEMAANMISGMLCEAIRAGNVDLAIADRSNLKKVLTEKDLALVGLVDDAKAAEAGKILGVQGLILSSINVMVEKHKGKGKTFGGIDFQALRDRQPGAVKFRKVETVVRHLTVQCMFRLVDAANGRVLLDHVSPILTRTDGKQAKRFFGADRTEADLMPRDYIIGELVEEEVSKFLGRFVPVRVTETIRVRSSGNDACKAGVRMLAVGEYDEAIRLFAKAIGEDDKGDKYARFGTGVAYEAKGQWSEALKDYQVALSEKVDGAEEAVRRVRSRLGP